MIIHVKPVFFKSPFYVADKNQWRKSVGRKPDGGQAFFWLGQHRAYALGLTEILLHWYAIKNGADWTDDELSRFQEFRDACLTGESCNFELPMPGGWSDSVLVWNSSFLNYKPPRENQRIPRTYAEFMTGKVEPIQPEPQTTQPAAVAQAKPQIKPEPVQTTATDKAKLSDALARFKEGVSRSSRSDRHRYGLVKHLEAVDLPDMPLAKFGFDAIAGAIDRQIGQAKRGHLSGQTVKNHCGALRQFISWLSRTDSFNPKWQPFAEWHSYFTEELTKLSPLIKARRSARKKANKLNPETLAQIIKSAEERLRLCTLLACNTGMSNTEIATLTPDMIHWGDRPFIDRDRHKTYVNAKWYLWPETAALLQPYVGDRRDKKPLFVTTDGNPLVWQRPNGVTIDNIAKQWTELLQRCGIVKMTKVKGKARVAERNQGFGWTFSFIRKYASDWIRAKYGKEFSEAFLAHSDSGVSDFYTTFKDWEGLGEATAALREHFQPLLGPPAAPDSDGTLPAGQPQSP